MQVSDITPEWHYMRTQTSGIIKLGENTKEDKDNVVYLRHEK